MPQSHVLAKSIGLQVSGQECCKYTSRGQMLVYGRHKQVKGTFTLLQRGFSKKPYVYRPDLPRTLDVPWLIDYWIILSMQKLLRQFDSCLSVATTGFTDL